MTGFLAHQHKGYLRQVLAQDKKPLALFIGAGCPVSIRTKEGGPLIPDIAGLTGRVRAALLAETTTKDAVSTVIKHFEDDERNDFNVETLLTHIRTLRQVVGKGDVRGLSSSELKTLEGRTTELIVDSASKSLPDSGTAYHSVAAWARATARIFPVVFFTTNYDLLLEQALEGARVPYFDGFVGARRPFFEIHAIEQDTLPPRWARLWKLHGSINWFEEDGTVYRSTTTQPSVTSRLIHPSHFKYDESRRMPYLVMLDQLRAYLQLPSACLITCGFSFRDEHINSVVLDALRANPTATVFGLLHGQLNGYSLTEHADRLPSNLLLLARDQACIGSRLDTWSAEQDPSTFDLGDFALFGKFLRELVGTDVEDI